MVKILFICSGGGHLKELLQLKDLFYEHNSVLLTEKVKFNIDAGIETKFLSKLERNNKIKYFFTFILVFIKSFIYFLKYNPEYIITTGASVSVPMCYISKIFRKKIIFIESIARVNSKSLTGKLLSKISDYIIVQWPEMVNIYNKSIYLGTIL